MSDVLDQLARIRVLLREQAEDCAQHAKYEQERLEVADKQRAETDTKKAELREKLEKIIKGREEIQTRDRTVESEDLDAIIRLLRENHDGRMEAIQKFIKDSSTFQCQRRTELLEEISRARLHPRS